jgi:hypothetical protein
MGWLYSAGVFLVVDKAVDKKWWTGGGQNRFQRKRAFNENH